MLSARHVALVVAAALATLAGVALFQRSGVSLVTGTVFEGQAPLVGARVRWKGTSISALTDSAGRFQLPKQTSDSVIAASKDGYQIGSASISAAPVSIQLTRLPDQDHAGYAWVHPAPDAQQDQRCGNCHAEIYRQWQTDGHANSARNPRFLDVYDRLLTDLPGGRTVCASCHVPTLEFNDPAFGNLRKTSGVAAEGVHCDFCHKVCNVSTESLGLSHGRFAMELLRPREGQLFLGPLDDVDRGEDAYSAVQKESRYCSACHEGTLFGVHVYGTYSEWLASPARQQGKQCQSCHMRPDGRMTNIAPGHGGIQRDPATLASHELLPGGLEAMLRRCLHVEVDVERNKDAVECSVGVLATDVGHRVPTGFIDRHLVLSIEGLDAGGQVLKTVTRLFARMLAEGQSGEPMPFWNAAGAMITDTRLLPEQRERIEATFAASVAQIRVRLIYRPFWAETGTVVVVDRLVPLGGK